MSFMVVTKEGVRAYDNANKGIATDVDAVAQAAQMDKKAKELGIKTRYQVTEFKPGLKDK